MSETSERKLLRWLVLLLVGALLALAGAALPGCATVTPCEAARASACVSCAAGVVQAGVPSALAACVQCAAPCVEAAPDAGAADAARGDGAP